MGKTKKTAKVATRGVGGASQLSAAEMSIRWTVVERGDITRGKYTNHAQGDGWHQEHARILALPAFEGQTPYVAILAEDHEAAVEAGEPVSYRQYLAAKQAAEQADSADDADAG